MHPVEVLGMAVLGSDFRLTANLEQRTGNWEPGTSPAAVFSGPLASVDEARYGEGAGR
jgi:hypothetical protein